MTRGGGGSQGQRSEARVPATLESRELWNGAGAQRGEESLGPRALVPGGMLEEPRLWRGTQRACLWSVSQ